MEYENGRHQNKKADKGKQKLDSYLPELLQALKSGNSALPPLMLGRDCYLEQSIQSGPCLHVEGEAARPINPRSRRDTHLNRNFLEENLKDYADQETLGHLVDGVHFKCNLPDPQLVLQANLKKLEGRHEELHLEHEKFEKDRRPNIRTSSESE